VGVRGRRYDFERKEKVDVIAKVKKSYRVVQ
jgi:hypothetical protein